jgi:hypothetical protein
VFKELVYGSTLPDEDEDESGGPQSGHTRFQWRETFVDSDSFGHDDSSREGEF